MERKLTLIFKTQIPSMSVILASHEDDFEKVIKANTSKHIFCDCAKESTALISPLFDQKGSNLHDIIPLNHWPLLPSHSHREKGS